ncbi:Fc.00g026420.m01.CDS01 [Cosmosporella sp. VM-42]
MRFTLLYLLVAHKIAAQCCEAQSPFAKTSVPSLNSSQELARSGFMGHASNAEPLSPTFLFNPPMSLMHQDGGNSGSSSSPGPRGLNVSVQTYATTLRVILWGTDGAMTAGMTNTTNGTTTFSLAGVNETTLEVQAYWVPPLTGEVLNFAYMALNQVTNQIIVASKQGNIYVVQREGGIREPSFSLNRTTNLASGILGTGEVLLNSLFDTAGNIWFTSGGLRVQNGFPDALGDPPQNSSTVGYVDPSGIVHTYHIANQMVENGIAVTGTTMFCVTGPSGTEDKTNATGYLFSFSPGQGQEVTMNWKATYDSGSSRKPGAWSRGSGSTPALLGNKFVAITDNADAQLRVMVYHQSAQCEKSDQLVCSTPIFRPGAGNNDVGLLVHLDYLTSHGEHHSRGTFGLVAFNNFNATPLYTPEKDTINGADWNDLGGIAAETVRVDVSEDGSTCGVKWDVPICIPSVPILSVPTGLIYGYTQDTALARDGEYLYEWYAIALDWRTGEEVWRVRTGAGGMLNDNYLPGSLGPDGSFFQGVFQGLVRIRDSEC